MTEPVVSYGLKEVLARLEAKLDQVVAAVGGKADRADVDRLDRRLDEHDDRLGKLEESRRTTEKLAAERRDHRRWLFPTLAAIVSALAAIIGTFAALH
jgi:hypothetical protein